MDKKNAPLKSIPQPPRHLMDKVPQEQDAGELFNEAIHQLDIVQQQQSLPPTVDASLYEAAVEDRKQAESGYAEFYSKYLELVSYNEQLMKNFQRFDIYRERIRKVYNNAKYGDDSAVGKIRELEKKVQAYEEIIAKHDSEKETLSISLKAHEEGFKNVSQRLEMVESELENSQNQFQVLAEEYDARGFLLSEANEKIKAYQDRFDRLNHEMNTIQSDNTKLRDDNVVFQRKLQEVTEGPIDGDNELLSSAVSRLQRRMREMEINYNREIKEAEQKIQKLQNSAPVTESAPTPKVAPQPPSQNAISNEQVDALFQRWDNVIRELSSHSMPIRDKKEGSKSPQIEIDQLVTENGEIDV